MSNQSTHDIFHLRNEPAHDKTYNKTCATGETQICLHILAVWSELLLIACAFYSLLAIHAKWDKREPLPTRWMYRMIWVFAGYTSLFCRFCCTLAQIRKLFTSYPSYTEVWIRTKLDTNISWMKSIQQCMRRYYSPLSYPFHSLFSFIGLRGRSKEGVVLHVCSTWGMYTPNFIETYPVV